MSRSLSLTLLVALTLGFSVYRSNGGEDLKFGAWEETVTFEGTLPCASCPGIETTMQLKTDGTFFSRRSYLQAADGADRSINEIGTWTITANRQAPGTDIMRKTKHTVRGSL